MFPGNQPTPEDFVIVNVENDWGVHQTPWNTSDEIKYGVEYRDLSGRDQTNWYHMTMGPLGQDAFDTKDEAYEGIITWNLRSREKVRAGLDRPVPARVYQIIKKHTITSITNVVEPMFRSRAYLFRPEAILFSHPEAGNTPE